MWRDEAFCLGTDPSVFFPTGVQGRIPKGREKRDRDAEERAAANKYCSRCSVSSECLEWALENQPFGVAGGKTEEERRVILRRREKQRKRVA